MSPPDAPDDVALNRAHWDAVSDEYQELNAPQLNTKELAWGVCAIPEDELHVLGEVSAKFGITLTAEAGVIVSKASAGATFEISVKFTRA